MKYLSFSTITFFTFIFSFVLPGCSNAYIKPKPVTPPSAYPAAITKAKEDNRYFILRSGINVYNVTSFQLDEALKAITVHLKDLDSLHTVSLQNPNSRRRDKKGQPPAVNEIHIYTKDSTNYTLDEPHTIPFDQISHIDLLGKS